MGENALGKYYQIQMPDFSVIDLTGKSKKLILEHPEIESAVFILCLRNSVVPQSNDYKVILSGWPLYIIEEENARTLVLEYKKPSYTVRMVQGDLTEQEIEAITKMNLTIQASGTAVPAVN